MQLSRRSSRASAVTLLAGEIQEAEVVLLNIGGRMLQTELSTLTVVPSSHLAQLAKHWQTFPQQPIFLDRNPNVGRHSSCSSVLNAGFSFKHGLPKMSSSLVT